MGQRTFAFSALFSDPQKSSMEADITGHSQPELFFDTGLVLGIILEYFAKPSFPQRTSGHWIVIEVEFVMYPQPWRKRRQLPSIDIDHAILEHQHVPSRAAIEPTRRIKWNCKKGLQSLNQAFDITGSRQKSPGIAAITRPCLIQEFPNSFVNLVTSHRLITSPIPFPKTSVVPIEREHTFLKAVAPRKFLGTIIG